MRDLCHENCEFDSNIEFHGCIFVIETVFMPVVKIFIGVLLAIWKKILPNIHLKYELTKTHPFITKNTPIYYQKHSDCTFASRKNAMYPLAALKYAVNLSTI